MSESESDTIVKLRQEVYNLKIENAELLGYNTHLKTAFNRLKASIEKDMENTEELRKDMRGKIVGLEEAKMRITQLEKELMNRKQVPELSKCDKNMIEDLKNQLSNQISSEIHSGIRSLSMKMFNKEKEISSHTILYSALNNLIVEAGEVIQDIQGKLILDDIMISEMNTDRIQKLVRDSKDYEKANEKLMSLKVEIRSELGSTNYSTTLQKEAKEAIESLTEAKKQLDNTLSMLEVEASDRKIKFSKLDTDTSKFYHVPIFKGENAEEVNIYEFFEQLTSYLEATNISPDEYGAVLKKSLQGTALHVVNKMFPNTLRPPMVEVKSLLIKHFGKPENILAGLKAKHEEIGEIPDIGTGDAVIIYRKSSDHNSLIQKALMLEDDNRQVEFPKAYIDTIEMMLPPIYLDKYSTYEIENEYAPNKEKLEKLKSLIDEIEAKGLLKSSLPYLPTTSKASFYEEPEPQDDTSKTSFYEEPQDDNSDQESTSISDHDWFDTDEDDEEPKLSYHWNKPAYQ